MARQPTITQEQVNAAADVLLAAGKKPTNRAVLEALGSGSMATIVKFLQQWRANQPNNTATTNNTIEHEIIKAINNAIAKHVVQATSEKNIQLAETQADLSSLILESERQAALIDIQEEKIAQLGAQTQNQHGQIEQLTNLANRTREELATANKEKEIAQIELAKVQLRIESLPALLEDLKIARADASKFSQEAAELRGNLAGIERVIPRKSNH